MNGYKTENFDTFYDHDQDASYIYAQQFPNIDMQTVILKDKYEWSERDRRGLTIYDKVYENLLDQQHSQYDMQSAYNFDDFNGMYSPQISEEFGCLAGTNGRLCAQNITLMQKTF